jgi:hypothetical protein
MPDHVHMLLSIPSKYAVSQVVGFIKGKSAIHVARVYGERRRNFVGQHFWARGFFVNTVGRDEEAIRAYIRNQENEEQRLEQTNLCVDHATLGSLQIQGAASATPPTASSGSRAKAPGSAGGYLLGLRPMTNDQKATYRRSPDPPPRSIRDAVRLSWTLGYSARTRLILRLFHRLGELRRRPRAQGLLGMSTVGREANGELGLGEITRFGNGVADDEHQPVGGDVQDEANLIGERRAARGAVAGELSLVQLDQIFRLAASAMEGW